MEWKPLQIEDRQWIETAFKHNLFPLSISDYTFTNLWMWNEERCYETLTLDSFLCIRFKEKGQTAFLYPIGNKDPLPVILKLKEMYSPFIMRAIPDNTALPFSLIAEVDHFDYIYSFEDLLKLPGNAYQAKRNLIHQFENRYEFSYHPIDSTLISQIIEMENEWFKEHLSTNDHQAALRALNHYSSLNIIGGALKVDKNIIAYILGEYITHDMLLIHVEKALTEYKGAYQEMFEQFLKHVKPVTFVNLEEDLGLPNLRKMKESYHPIRMGKTFRLELT